jgi:hypothetical protein
LANPEFTNVDPQRSIRTFYEAVITGIHTRDK